MPWALHTLNSSEPLRKRTYFLTREKIIVGRKEDDGNDIVVSKKSVSRKHATIRIAESSFNVRRLDSRPSIEMEDHSSFGTSINGITVNKTKKNLRDGDTIQFAKSQIVFKVQFVPIVICVTGIGSSKRKEMLRQTFRKLGIHYQSVWGEYITHVLTERPLTITVKFLRALLCGIPVINREWIDRILARATLDEPLPQESQCLLSLDSGARRFEATGQVESIYSVKKERKTLFKNCSFVFVSQSEFVWMIRAGGGQAYEFHNMSKREIDNVVSRAEKSESSRNWFFVQPFTNLSSQRRGETQSSQQEFESSKRLYDRMMRVKANEVGEDMIGQSIVSCKISTLFGKKESTTMVIKHSHPTIVTSSNASSSSLSVSSSKKSPVVKKKIKKMVTPTKEVLSPKETPSKWSSMSYNELRKELKKRGMKAGGKKVNLLKRLEEYEMNTVELKKSDGEVELKEKSDDEKMEVEESSPPSKARRDTKQRVEKVSSPPSKARDTKKRKKVEKSPKKNIKKRKKVEKSPSSSKKQDTKKKEVTVKRTATTEDDGWICPRRKKKTATQTEVDNDSEKEEENDTSTLATQKYDREEEQEEEQEEEEVNEVEETENVPPSPRQDLSGIWVTKKRKKKSSTTSESHPKAVVESRKMMVKQTKEKKKSQKKKNDNGVNFKRFRKNLIATPCTSPVAFALPVVPNETQEERERRRLFEDDLMNEKKADMIWDLEEKSTKKKKKRRTKKRR
eukprot:g5666.t1